MSLANHIMQQSTNPPPLPCGCQSNNLHHMQRYDQFEQSRHEPVHYPPGIQSSYHREYTAKSRPSDGLGVMSAKEAFALGKNPISGLSNQTRPRMEGHTTMSREYLSSPPVDTDLNRQWADNNRSSAQTDHLAREGGKGEGKKWTTEYRVANQDAGKEVIVGAGPGKVVRAPKERLESKTVYTGSYTPKGGQKDYVDPRKTYAENLKVVRSYFDANNVGVGKGTAHPTRDTTTYFEEFVKTKKEQRGIPLDAAPAQPLGARPSAVNNWRTARGPLQASTVYQKDFKDQHMVACPLQGRHLQAASPNSQLSPGNKDYRKRFDLASEKSSRR